MNEDLTLQKSPTARIRDYFDGIRVEMRRVTWPGKQEVYGTTMMVILTTFAFGLFFYVCDVLFHYLIVVKVIDSFLHRK